MKSMLEEIVRRNFTDQKERQYYIEAQVQHKIAIEIFKAGYLKNMPIEPILEYRINNSRRNTNEYIDIVLDSPDGKTGIELKYKTTAKDGTLYSNQGGQNNGKYDFIKDISRLERAKNGKLIAKGYALFLTNDNLS